LQGTWTTTRKTGAKFPLLINDEGSRVAQQFGIIIQEERNDDDQDPNSTKSLIAILPATYIIDSNTRIVYAFVECNITQ
jgi:peroxiredoxin